MNEIINILLGLQIGIQLVAAYFVLKIMRMKTTPYLPYVCAFIALLLMVGIRLDWIFAVMPPVIKISEKINSKRRGGGANNSSAGGGGFFLFM